MAKTRRTFTPEFKAQAVKLVTEQGKSLAEVARDLDLGESMLRAWKQALAKDGDQVFPGKGNPPALEEELRRLRAENKRLTMERDILKKATAFFASYYDWRGRPLSARAQRREALIVSIKAIHGEVKARYGSPRIHAEL